MSTLTITGYYKSGVTVPVADTVVQVKSTGTVKGGGIYATAHCTVYNSGLVAATETPGFNGINLGGGGDLYNYKDISGGTGVLTSGTVNSNVTNKGSIYGRYVGVQMSDGGAVANYGSIFGGTFGINAYASEYVSNNGYIESLNFSKGAAVSLDAGTVANAGTIAGGERGVIGYGVLTVVNIGSISGANGVVLDAGGLVTNGYFGTAGVISAAYNAVKAVGGTIRNTSTILSNDGNGVALYSGATLTNGSNTYRGAIIQGVTAVASPSGAVIHNYATIKAPAFVTGSVGVFLNGTGLRNGTPLDTVAVVEGDLGVKVKGAGDILNYGTIDANGTTSASYAVDILANGTLTNGTANSRKALVEGYGGVSATGTGAVILNFGTIETSTGLDSAVILAKGGTVINGSLADTAAILKGGYGVAWAGTATIENFGTITAPANTAVLGGGFAYADGVVTNGAATDTTALIEGYGGVLVTGAATVTNFGTVVSHGAAAAGVGVASGMVANGSGSDTTALISGAYGVSMAASGVLTNYGLIEGQGRAGAYLGTGGQVDNGLGADRSAVIEGNVGVLAKGAATVVNAATIIGEGTSLGVELAAGGALRNGSAVNGAALIEGYSGVSIAGKGASTNFGTIAGLGGAGTAGLIVGGYGALTNGASGHVGAIVEGYAGVLGATHGTFANFGTVIGEGGAAVSFASSTDDLIVEAGAVFVGSITGGGGTLDLGSGAGTLTGLLTGGNVTVSGSMATTTFSDFHTVRVDAGASFVLAGGAAIPAGEALSVAGTANTSGTIAVTGAFVLGGSLAGSGTLALAGGTSTFSGAGSDAIARTTESGASTVLDVTGSGVGVSGVFAQSAGTVSVASGDRISFSGAGDVFNGVLAGAGTIAFTGGTDLIAGASLTAASQIVNGAAVTLSGAITESGAMSVTATNLTVAAAGATLTGAGSLNLSNLATNVLRGASASATLANAIRITGAGTIGAAALVLVNQAAGVIDGNASNALTINTGVSTITNAGVIENGGAGGTTVLSPVANSGTLMVTAGLLDFKAVVTGAGSVKIAGGVAEFGAAFAQNVAFTGATGVLELARSQSYTGQVSGFSKTGTTSFDLLDITFGGSTKATYSGTTASGVLTVTDGTHTAHITLIGNYTASSWNVSSDGHGGVTVVDPTVRRPSPLQPLTAAMARFGATGDAGGRGEASALVPAPAPLLARISAA